MESKNGPIKIEIANPTDDDIAMMESYWQRFEREHIWPGERFEEEHPEVVAKSKAEQIHDWEDWFCERMLLTNAA